MRRPDITHAGRPGFTPSTLITKLEATPTNDRITVIDVNPESSIVELTADTPHKSTMKAAA
jgi:acetolactate synthase small subunit